MADSRLTLNEAAFALYSGPVMACADQGYRLALVLLLDESKAIENVKSAFESIKGVLDRITNREEALIYVAKCVYEEASLQKAKGQGKDFGMPGLENLSTKERAAIGMVDMLGLTLEDSTEAMGCEEPELIKTLASARSQLMAAS